MRAVVIHAAKDLRVDEVPDGELSAGQVRLRIERGGICGSDLHYYNHGGFGTVRLREPMVLGHEVAGRVAEVGAGVSAVTVGDLVAVCPSRPDWSDQYSREGAPNHSLGMQFYGSAMPFPHVQGAFSEQLVVEAEQCAVVPAHVSAAQAAMAEPLAVGLHAVRRAGEMIGKRVLVTGCGPIGVLLISAIRRAGAAQIVATDLCDEALAFARRAGADDTVNVATEAERMQAYEADKGYFHVMFEASGAGQALAHGLRMVRPRGVVLQLGMGGDMTLPVNLITTKELELRGSFRFNEEFFWAVEMIAKGLIDVKPVLTHEFSLARAVEAFDMACDRSKAMKVQLDFLAA